MSNTISPNMNLVIPGVGTEPGPDWATDINSDLSILDQHDHSAGSGVPITPNGININSDLSANNNNIIAQRSSRFQAQSAPLALSTDRRCLYSVGVDLYFNDGSGNQIRVTQSGGIAGSPGSIANLTSPASASYVAADQTFVWQSDVNTPANMDAASYIFRNLIANSFGLTLNPPAAMANDITQTLPSVPASTLIMTMDNTGAMAAVYGVDNTTIDISANLIEVKNLGISTAKIADGAVTFAKLAANTVPVGKVTTYSSPGTFSFSVPADVSYVDFVAFGGGGGGAGGSNGGGSGTGGGGGAGAPIQRGVIAVTPSGTLAVVVGSHGVHGTANADGSDGGSTTVGGLTCVGGLHGVHGSAGGTAGAQQIGNYTYGFAGGNGGAAGAGAGGGTNVFLQMGGGSGGSSIGSSCGGGGGGGASYGAGGGGGNGNLSPSAGAAGTSGAGGGGGGNGNTGAIGGDGGDGGVILYYQTRT